MKKRISKQEESDNILFAKIDKLRDKMDGDHDIVLQRIRGLEKRVWMHCWWDGSYHYWTQGCCHRSKILDRDPSNIYNRESYTK